MGGLRVMAMKPCWRYCVIYEGAPPEQLALSFYTLRRAERFARKMAASRSMHSRMLIFRKARWRWRTIGNEPIQVLPSPTSEEGDG